MLAASSGREEHIGMLAASQHGVVTRRQLINSGITSGAVEHRLRDGRLRRLHAGVYQVGPTRATYAVEMAAVLACGERAVVSHRSAAALLRVYGPLAPSAPVDVSVPRGEHRLRPGIRTHRPIALPLDEVTRFDGIPITTPARTLVDLASCVSTKRLERALAEAFTSGLATRREVFNALSKYPNRPGTGLLRHVIEGNPERAMTRSDAEDRFRELIERARLPRPEVNVRLKGRERDFVWRSQRLVAEVDGYRFHAARDRFESDRRRDAQLVAAGFRVVRVTWRQLQKEPEAVIACIAQALAR